MNLDDLKVLHTEFLNGIINIEELMCELLYIVDNMNTIGDSEHCFLAKNFRNELKALQVANNTVGDDDLIKEAIRYYSNNLIKTKSNAAKKAELPQRALLLMI